MTRRPGGVLKIVMGALCLGALEGGVALANERPLNAESRIVLTPRPPVDGIAQLQIDYPAAFSDRLDIYVSSNLQSGVWRLAGTNLITSGFSTLSWIDPDAAVSGVRFYRAGNADWDTDADGLPDAREILIHRTDPLAADTDGDGVPDGAEIRRGTDPVAGDARGITVFADSDTGSDSYDGLSPEAAGNHGPKRTLGAACGMLYSRDVLQLRGCGVFREPSLCVSGRDWVIRPVGDVVVQP
ncbi:MAG: hypothetical protein WCO42_08335 [bacterium]